VRELDCITTEYHILKRVQWLTKFTYYTGGLLNPYPAKAENTVSS